MKNVLALLLWLGVNLLVLGETVRLCPELESSNGHGLRCRLDGKKTVLFLSGTPSEMGTAHGELMRQEIQNMYGIILVLGANYSLPRNDWFFTRIAEVIRRTTPYTPPRFLEECDAMSEAAGIAVASGRHLNFFSEMFHCSGVAVRNRATADGRLIHARVLDYMRDIGIQNYSTVMVFMPKDYNAWLSESFAGFIGTVTAMNEKGLAMGELGGNGVGKWDGLPMSFLMRRVMEECATVAEAIRLMQSVPLTCDYYYVLSDINKDMAGIVALSGQPLKILKPGEVCETGQTAVDDTVYISPKERGQELAIRLRENFGRIDVPRMIEIIKRPVAMKSNLHNAIFLPETGTMYFADAGAKTLACDETYYKVNLFELLSFYRQGKAGRLKNLESAHLTHDF